jgi:acyl-CoA synthetase (AMP-forming)/AMP-acid ligase II
MFSWSEVEESRNRLANSLLDLRGVGVGAVAAIFGMNSAAWVTARLTCVTAGLFATPVNWHLAPEEVEFVINNCGATIVFADEELLAPLLQAKEKYPKVVHWISLNSDGRATEPTLDMQTLIRQGKAEAVATQHSRSSAGVFNSGKSMLYTGGSTGRPKCVVRTGERPNTAPTGAWLKARGIVGGEQVHLVVAPLNHAAPGNLCVDCFNAGATSIIMRKFEAGLVLQTIKAWSVSMVLLPPILIKRLLIFREQTLNTDRREASGKQRMNTEFDSSSLKCVIVTGAPCPQSVKESFLSSFGPVLWEFYGSSEFGVCTALEPEEVLTKAGSCGRAAPGLELAIIDEKTGRRLPAIISRGGAASGKAEDGGGGGKVRGDGGGDGGGGSGGSSGGEVAPDIMGHVGVLFVKRFGGEFDRYLDNTKATAEVFSVTMDGEEWGTVGDLAYMDNEGFVYMQDRRTDLIISGGVNIYPAEVEGCIQQHPAVADVAVVGLDDEEWGQRLHGLVQIVAGYTTESTFDAVDLGDGQGITSTSSALTAPRLEVELKHFVRERMAGYKVPRAFSFTVLPRTEAGKLNKKALRTRLQAHLLSKGATGTRSRL